MKIKNHGISLIALSLIVLIAMNGLAQEGTPVVVRDLETWTLLGVKLQPHKRIDFTLDEELRLSHNSSQVDKYFTNAKLSIEIIKKLNLGMGYRFIRENDDDVYESHQRFAFDLSYGIKLQRLTIQPCVKYQFKDELGVSKDDGDYLKSKLRFKLKLKYNIKNWKLDPVFSSELFRQYETGTVTEFEKLRFTFSTSFKYKKISQFNIFYSLERELNAEYPKTTNVFGIQYRFIAKKSKK